MQADELLISCLKMGFEWSAMLFRIGSQHRSSFRAIPNVENGAGFLLGLLFMRIPTQRRFVALILTLSFFLNPF